MQRLPLHTQHGEIDLDHEAIREAVAVLRAGGLVIFPTETTYGAGVDACNPQAVQKLLRYKSRREGKPLSIAVTNKEMAAQYVELNPQAEVLYQQFLPGPVTVVSYDRDVVAPGVASEFGTVGVRIPDYPLVIEIVRQLGRPITATSANGSGQKRPYTIEDVLSQLSGKQHALIDLILDAGQLPTRPPSTVIDTTLSTPVTLREGSITVAGEQDGGPTTLVSRSEQETKKIAGQLLLKHWDSLQHGPIVIALDGPLGVGKTVFTKGAAQFLHITQQVTSPTYTYIEEYDFTRHQTTGRLYHLDMWKVDSSAEFARLSFEKLLQPNTVIVVEWWQQVAAFVEPLLAYCAHVLIHSQLQDDSDNSENRRIVFSERVNLEQP